jgi:hypothetical protein
MEHKLGDEPEYLPSVQPRAALQGDRGAVQQAFRAERSMTVTEEELIEIGRAFQTLGAHLPIRREGEEIPDAPSGRFSVGWHRGPVFFYRKGNRKIRMGLHLYATPDGGGDQRVGQYVDETFNETLKEDGQ